MRVWGTLAVCGAIWLAACANPKKEPSLEERAQAGDPVASCQILVTKLQACTEEISLWKGGGQEPFCSYNRPRLNDQAHVNEVFAALKSDPSRNAKFSRAIVRLAAISLTLETYPAEQSRALLDDMEKTCPTL